MTDVRLLDTVEDATKRYAYKTIDPDLEKFLKAVQKSCPWLLFHYSGATNVTVYRKDKKYVCGILSIGEMRVKGHTRRTFAVASTHILNGKTSYGMSQNTRQSTDMQAAVRIARGSLRPPKATHIMQMQFSQAQSCAMQMTKAEQDAVSDAKHKLDAACRSGAMYNWALMQLGEKPVTDEARDYRNELVQWREAVESHHAACERMGSNLHIYADEDGIFWVRVIVNLYTSREPVQYAREELPQIIHDRIAVLSIMDIGSDPVKEVGARLARDQFLITTSKEEAVFIHGDKP